MCGILGCISVSGEAVSPPEFDRALGLLDHRGPDDRGAWHSTTPEGVAISMGQTRLSILDLSEAGHQPMFSPRSGVCIVFNGEIYNFREIRERLAALGYRFTSECDTEVILAAYDEWQDACVEKFRGMFAIAMFDPNRQRIILFRDRLGIKPFYYYWDGARFAFGSEVTALAALPGLDLNVCTDALWNYLRQAYVPGPMSIFTRVRKLTQGHSLEFDLRRREPLVRRYWDPIDFYARPRAFRDEGEIIDAVEEELTRAVKLRLISDVPLGAFLSGGIDSSLVVALMRKVHTGALRTFTIGFSEPEWDEAPAARRIAEHLGTEHHEEYINEANVLEAARRVGQFYDEPFADESNIPTLLLSEMTRRHVTVALSGDGGDELFWGYHHYNSRAMRLYDSLAKVPRFARRAGGFVLKRLGSEGYRLGDLLGFDDLPMYYMRTKFWPVGQYERLLAATSPRDRLLEIGREVCGRLPGRDRVLLSGAMDLHGYLVDDILTKVDRASMAVALEARVPILDHEVVQLAASIPTRFKTAGGDQKHLLKRLLSRHLPEALWRRPKRGFGIPLVRWFRTSLRDWAYDELTGSRSHIGEWLDKGELRRILDDHCSGRRNLSGLIWSCIQLVQWDRRITSVRGARVSPPASGLRATPSGAAP
ncbi:MAG: asparagine synthase (glutamine-hydrolyzing) [Planctomycetota bacterium]|nr:MAG: asparagine synthase (glutamine-hydrolyzing) [Planctomycetota bacterium]